MAATLRPSVLATVFVDLQCIVCGGSHDSEACIQQHKEVILREMSGRPGSGITFGAEEEAEIRRSLLSTPQAGPVRSGACTSLFRLPPEILGAIVDVLDVRSVFRLRQASSALRAFTTATKHYRAVADHAPGALVAMARLRLFRRPPFTLGDVHARLFTARCARCACRGAYLFLPTLHRFCKYHLWECEALSVVQRTGSPYLSRDNIAAVAAALERHPDSWFVRRWRDGAFEYSTPVSVSDGLPRPSRPRVPSPQPCRRSLFSRVTLDYRSPMWLATPFPSFDDESGSFQVGVTCKGCCRSIFGRVSGHTFSPSGFLEHFRRCRAVQKRWVEWSLGDGAVEPAEDSQTAVHDSFEAAMQAVESVGIENARSLIGTVDDWAFLMEMALQGARADDWIRGHVIYRRQCPGFAKCKGDKI